MNYLQKYIYLFCLSLGVYFFVFVQMVQGQDIHFSQTATSPLNLNPAETGVFQGQYRFTANHRNQWFSISNPFTTFSAGFDASLYRNQRSNYIIASGLLLNTDIAGSSRYTEMQAMASVAFIKGLNRKKTNFLSLGIQGGIGQHNLDYSRLQFDNQFDGKQYNPDIVSEEALIQPTIYPDIAAGIYWLYQPRRDLIYNAGFSVFHINRPSLSFFDNENIYINPRYMTYFRMEFEIGTQTQMIPVVYFQTQHNYREVLVGTNFRFVQNFRRQDFSAFNTGIYFRGWDAVILSLGWDWKAFNFGLSYDMNISSLKSASKTIGAYELSVIYISNKNKKPKPTKMPCFIF